MDFVIRAVEPGDEGLIFASWSRCARLAPPMSWVPWRTFDAFMRKRFGGASTLVACHPDDPSMMIGFICFNRSGDTVAVHWVYVVSMFRRKGVAKGLLEAVPHERIVSTSTSKEFGKWLREKSRSTYDPYFGL
jgi:GNAT superfamily N-acetyltransferase